MNLNFNKAKISKIQLIAFILFLVNQFQNIFIGVAINFFGVYDFTATNYWNRVYIIFVFIVMYYSLSIPKYFSRNKIVLIFLFFFISLYGFINNSFNDFITDFILIVLPIVFYNFFKKVFEEKEAYLFDFMSTYYKLNVWIIIPVVFLRLINFKILNIDFNYLICFSIAQIISQKKSIYINKLYIYKNIFFSFLAGIGKVIIAQTFLFIALRSFNLRRIHYFIFIFFLVIISVRSIDKYGDKLSTLTANAGSLPRGIDLIQKTDFAEIVKIGFSNLDYLIKDPAIVFTLTDPSTGQRFFELFTAISTIDKSISKKLIGLGIGGTLDQSETRDGSIASSHDDITKVRVMHLLLTFLLAKFGYILTVAILIFLIYFLTKAIKIFRKTESRNFFELIGAVGIFFYFVGGFFTVGLFLKDFMLGFYIYCFALNWKQIQKKESL